MALDAQKLADALEDARHQGLPHDWTLTLDDKGRKKWTSPGQRPRSFAYLQRALDHVNKQKGISSAGKKRPMKKSGSNAESSASSRPAAKKKTKKSSSSSSHFDHADSDPETSLDVPKDDGESGNANTNANCSSRFTGTVHWDPYSPQGLKVGHRIRVWDCVHKFWKSGRIIRYDPRSHKHKVVFFYQNNGEEYNEEWMYLDRENTQQGGRFVWALVKGFAWWPAQILHCHYPNMHTMPNRQSGPKDLTMNPVRDGYVLVEFFDSDEVASIKNSPEFLREFKQGTVDAIIRKNKKKRNAKAVETAKHEERTTQEVRNDAAKFYAEKAFHCVNRPSKADGLLGVKVEIFRSDINYPVGTTLVGTVRSYSPGMKKHLIAYDLPPANNQVYAPTWENFTSQRFKLLGEAAKQKKRYVHNPTKDDLYPFLFGNEEIEGNRNNSDIEVSAIKCRGCVMNCDLVHEIVLICSKCKGAHHAGCLDPPMSMRAAETLLKSDEIEEWTCNKCARCVGCRELEITFGPKTINSIPPSLYLPRNTTLQLCDSCIPMYEKDSFCPICAHVWDDARYQKIQKRLKNENKGIKSEEPEVHLERKRIPTSNEAGNDYLIKPTTESCGDDVDTSFRWKHPDSVDNSFFFPEKNVWGYNEGTMLSCDKCNLWVHAGCAQLTRNEYEQTSRGEHDIYSREFLCRSCCKEKCLYLVSKLMEEDTMYLFAAPVTEQVAHNYRDIIKNPMDLQTMSERAHIGNYRNYAWLREAFELMVYNALLFNLAHSKYWEEARRFYLACRKNVFAKDGKGAPPSKYKSMIKERFELAEKMVQAEKDRVKADKTAEKKDLVAGDQVLSVKLGPLVNPCDPPSCVPTSVVRLNSVDAFYSAWLECCFSCGSSGALDTMLFCVDCGEAYHSFCASAPIKSMNNAAVNGWRCPNCKLDEITGEVTQDELKLLYCEMCDRAFSIDNISPPLDKIPSGLWICGQCVDCTECKNTLDDGKVSRNFWSRDPSLCFSCGGCNGLDLECVEKGRCRVCKKIHRSTDGLPKCSSCGFYTHHECDPTLSQYTKTIEEGQDKKNKYCCPKCRKRKAKARKRKIERAKEKESSKPKQSSKDEESAKSSVTIKTEKTTKPEKKKTSLKPKRYVPSKHLSKEEQKIEALAVALKEAQSRGLPEGWSCFYGAANRKRWRSPAPVSRVFDSIPKALQYAEKVKNGLVENPKSGGKRIKKEVPTKCNFKFFQLHLDEEGDWRDRERGYDDNTSLMSDAEVILELLESKIGKQMALIFDRTGDLFKKSPHVQNLPQWILSRAGRFVRFVRRLRSRSNTKKSRQGAMSSTSAQTVVCKMASSFLYSVCIMFKVNIRTTIRSWQKMRSLLVTADEGSGTVDLSFHAMDRGNESESVQSINEASDINMLPGFEDFPPISTLVATTPINFQQPEMVYNPLVGKSQNDFNIADALMTLASPPRSKKVSLESPDKVGNQTLPLDSFRPMSKTLKVTHGFGAPMSIGSTSNSNALVQNMQFTKINVAESRSGRIFSPNEVPPGLNNHVEKGHANSLPQTNSEEKNCSTISAASSNQLPDEQRTCKSIQDSANKEAGSGLLDHHSSKVSRISGSSSLETFQIKNKYTANKTSIIKDQSVENKISGTDHPFLRPERRGLEQIDQANNDDTNDPSLEHPSSSPVKDYNINRSPNDKEIHPFTEDNAVSIKEELATKVKLQREGNVAEYQKSDVIFDQKIQSPAKAAAIPPEKVVSLPWHNHQFEKVKPMRGWNPACIESSPQIKWTDSRTCSLCHISGDDDAGLPESMSQDTEKYEKVNGSGRLLPLPSGGWMHSGCALWSSEVWENPIGGILSGATKAKSRSSKLRCFGCGQIGATLGCHRSSCNANFHFACAKACGVAFTKSHKLFCNAHKQFAKDELITDFSEPMKILRIVDDKVQADPELCYRSGTLVVHSLGKIEQDCDGFHSQKYITPPGFFSTRIFWSFVKPKTRTVYIMRILKSPKNTALYLATAADAPTINFRGVNVVKIYNDIMKRVLEINKEFFSAGDQLSIYPMIRSKKNKNGFCLNGPQFFGFGVNFIREALETTKHAVACAVPLSNQSPAYQFCFQNPSEEAVTELQRKRAVVKAEKALENLTGCARTEGDFDKSKGSGRITRDLVRTAGGDPSTSSSKALSKGADTSKSDNNTSFESIQAKYLEMKSVPMEVRLAARRSHIHGWGLFAKQDFKKNSMIAEYMGEAISQPIADKREKMYEVLGMGSCYMFRLDFHEIVDATQIGCMSRFMNHCCRANAYANVITVNTERGLEKKIVVFANQDIKNGDEITYDYKFPVEDGSLRCTCGAPNCIGRMN